MWDLPSAIITPSPHTFFARRLTVKVVVPRTAIVRGVEIHTEQEEMPECVAWLSGLSWLCVVQHPCGEYHASRCCC